MTMLEQPVVPQIQFIDLPSQQQRLKGLSEAIERVLAHGAYIFGPEIYELEKKLIEYTGAFDVVTCANGTDALRLLMLYHGVGPGDAVFVPTFTFASTAEIVALAKATPVFVDICPHTYNIDIGSLERAIDVAKKAGLKPKGIIGVDLFGLPADYPKLNALASAHDLWLVADAAQSIGGGIGKQSVGTLAPTSTTSFFPSKPLACYGDGGAIFTTSKDVGDTLRSLRNHGCGQDRYDHIHIGLNSRLDTLQAAILIEKLKIFPQEHQRREAIANFYANALDDIVTVPKVGASVSSAWALYTIQVEEKQRDPLIEALKAKGIPSTVYYRKPLHHQIAYQHYPAAPIKHADELSHRVLSLPMHPYLTDEQLGFIVETVRESII